MTSISLLLYYYYYYFLKVITLLPCILESDMLLYLLFKKYLVTVISLHIIRYYRTLVYPTKTVTYK